MRRAGRPSMSRLVDRGTMRVTVHQRVDAARAASCRPHRARRDVHDFGRSRADVHLAAGAQLRGRGLRRDVEAEMTQHPQRERDCAGCAAGADNWCRPCTARRRASAARVRRAGRRSCRRSSSLQPVSRANRLPTRKSRLPCMKKQGTPRVGQAAQCRDDLSHGRVRIVIAEPGFEQVTEDVERARVACLRRAGIRANCRAIAGRRRIEVQVGDEAVSCDGRLRGRHGSPTTRADSMTTGCSGASSGNGRDCSRRHTGDLVDDVHAVDHAAEDRVTPARRGSGRAHGCRRR